MTKFRIAFAWDVNVSTRWSCVVFSRFFLGITGMAVLWMGNAGRFRDEACTLQSYWFCTCRAPCGGGKVCQASVEELWNKMSENGWAELLVISPALHRTVSQTVLPVLLSVPRCLTGRAAGFLLFCCASQRNPTGLEWLRSVPPRG